MTKRWLTTAILLWLTVGSASDDTDSAADDTTTTEVEDVGAPVPSAGCGASVAEPGVEVEHPINVRGAPRRYLLTTPSAHDGETPLPVVLDFHGLLEGAEVHATMSQWSALAEEAGVVAVFPHGTGEPVHWDFDISDPDGNDDLAYTDAVLAELGEQLCIDQSRVYTTGLSNGAMFTSALLWRAEVIAAAAPVAGLTDLDGCDPSRPVPVLTYHGTADPILLFNGGVELSGIPGGGGGPTTTAPPTDLDGEGYPAAVAAFAERNGCDPEPADSELTDEVLRRVYDCPDGADVEFLIIEGGGHSWPSSEFSRNIEPIVGPTTFDVDATRDSWEFLEQFHL